jgi:DNA polymerase-3 subunit beta
MKLTIEKPGLVNALAHITSIVERKNTIPILGNVLLSASTGVLTIKGTDLDIEVTSTVHANVDVSGETTVSAQMLSDIVKKAPNGSLISFDLDKDGLTIKFGRSRFHLATLEARDFPLMANAEYDVSFELSAHDIGRLFGKTAFAMSTEETQYYLCGVYFHHTGEGVTAVSTTGQKLAKVTVDDMTEFPGVIVPRKTVTGLAKSMTDNPVTVSVSQYKIRFSSGNTVIVSKVIDGSFPDYARVIPKSLPNVAVAVASEMRAASERVAMVSDDKARAVTLTMGDGVIGLRSKGSTSEAEDAVDAAVDGEFIQIGFNSRFLAEALSQCDAGNVRIEYAGSMEPCIIRPEDDPGYMAIVMPWRV